MDEITIACLVEGHGEVRAVPALLRRLAQHRDIWHLRVPTPQRVPRSRLVNRGELVTQVQAIARRVPGPGGVLVLLDADDDCPAKLGVDLQAQAQAARPDKKVAVVLANKEFEAWFLASAGSLAAGFEPPPEPEAIRDAKGWLAHRMRYRETVDQARLAAQFDLTAARQNARSFDKFCRAVEWLLSG
jgi:hypothetical protein